MHVRVLVEQALGRGLGLDAGREAAGEACRFWLASSQPTTLTSLLFALLKYATPSAKPSMKIVTGGIWMPPKVPTTPVFE